jgi:glyoxylase-like metal-dependent hydrolase (beta-lactamase superfamily II)
VRKPTRAREVGRGERVLAGVWRLRLPIELPGVPHVNAWALQAGDGIVLVDTGLDEPGSMAQLERALERTQHRVEDVRLIVLTHAHPDHAGQAMPIAERAGCEVWIHPAYRLHAQRDDDWLERRLEVARQSGVPETPLRRWAERRRDSRSGIAGTLASDRDLLPGVRIDSDVGAWDVIETPGHAPSHVCLHQPGHRLLITGDHLLGRVSQYFDVGFTPDPVGEFLHSLDVVDALDARLALAGHARPFTDVRGHVNANRELVRERLGAVRAALAAPRTAYEVARTINAGWDEDMAPWLMTLTRAWLIHLDALGEAVKAPPQGDDPAERWESHRGAAAPRNPPL